MERAGSIQLEIPDFSNSVLSHLNQLRMQGRLCDIIVNVQGQSFRAHKVVLAASSPYFRDHMSLGEMSTVSISVIRNPSVFEQLLSFCYTGRLCLQLADIISYLTAASFLQMQHIIDKCTQILENIHFKINVADVEAELNQGSRGKHQERTPEGGRSGMTRSLSPRHSSPRGGRRAGGVSPPEESMSPQIIEHSSDGNGKEPILRINRAGQWYVETGLESDRASGRSGGMDDDVRVVDGLRIKTERMEEWMGAETQASGEEGSSAEEVTAMMIDTTGHSLLAQESSGAKGSQPSSSFSEMDRRFSPTGSVVVMAERQRAKSESPGRMDDQRQPTSQGEEQTVFDMGGYEEYLREQVGDRWFRYNPRLTCIYCCKSFNQKGSLDRHMRLHMGITPFVCRICGKKYTRRTSWSTTSANTQATSRSTATLCGKSFPSRQSSTSTSARTTRVALRRYRWRLPETTVTSRARTRTSLLCRRKVGALLSVKSCSLPSPPRART
ncbi:zinc finger and BTB domain-containing protein 37-like, partial [Acipenser oxyrinchus oxyrinchus]